MYLSVENAFVGFELEVVLFDRPEHELPMGDNLGHGKAVDWLRIDKSPWGLGYPRGLEVRSCRRGMIPRLGVAGAGDPVEHFLSIDAVAKVGTATQWVHTEGCDSHDQV